jgi:hypothetical protein
MIFRDGWKCTCPTPASLAPALTPTPDLILAACDVEGNYLVVKVHYLTSVLVHELMISLGISIHNSALVHATGRVSSIVRVSSEDLTSFTDGLFRCAYSSAGCSCVSSISGVN